MPVSICNVKRYNNDRQSYGRLINEFWNFKIDCIKRRHRIWYINLVMVLCNSNNNNSCSNNSLNKIAFLTTMATIFRFLAAMQLLSKCFSVIDYFWILISMSWIRLRLKMSVRECVLWTRSNKNLHKLVRSLHTFICIRIFMSYNISATLVRLRAILRVNLVVNPKC